jgi:methionyl-tRNA formyltransferase
VGILLCLAGIKGLKCLEAVLGRLPIAGIVSYRQKNISDEIFDAINHLCITHRITFVQSHKPSFASLEPFELCFMAGWQYMLPDPDPRVVVFHDSLLPRYRGFNPTVSALLAGDRRIGVSALLPSDTPDGGPLLAQESVAIDYPITIAQALDRLAPCYGKLAERIVALRQNGTLAEAATPQVENQATYSLWRDADDQWIDWSLSSDRIQRFVDALGWPYTGARTRYGGEEVIIHAVVNEADLVFQERHPGKIWRLNDGQPVVVCGSGMLRIVKAAMPSGDPISFTRLRSRFR